MALNVTRIGAFNAGQYPCEGCFTCSAQGQNSSAFFARELRGNVVQDDVWPGLVRVVTTDIEKGNHVSSIPSRLRLNAVCIT